MNGTEREFEASFAVTDASGRLVFEGLSQGRYVLGVSRDRYVGSQVLDQSHRGTPLSLAPGQHRKDLVFRLTPTAVISGKITQEDGEPLPSVQVQAMRLSSRIGKRELYPEGVTSSTNDLGEYRIWGLAPGRYYIGFTYYGTPGIRFATGEGYVPIYYPGVSDPDRAVAVDLRPGEELSGIDLSLVPVQTVRVSGHVIDVLTTLPAKGTQVTLLQHQANTTFWASRSSVDAKGAFELRGVAPGSYILIAQQSDKPQQGRGSWGRRPIEVGDVNLDAGEVVIGPGIDVGGRVRVEGKVSLDFGKLIVALQPQDDWWMMGMLPGNANDSVKPDGTFAFTEVPEGTYSVDLFPAPDGFYLKSARQGSEDVLEGGLRISRGQAPPRTLDLTLSPSAGQIEGTVLKQQQPFAGAVVVLVPEPKRRSQARYFSNVETDQFGRFALRNIAPGIYQLFAWEEIEGGVYMDPDFLRKYEHSGKSVRLEEGARLSVQLEVIPAAANLAE